jgi:N-acetylmuramic acid 6-phosphate etherase
MTDLAHLLTEARNASSEGLDRLSTGELLRVINAADYEVADAVERELPNLALAVDAVVSRFEAGGRLFYIGAGTSGRLGVLDASECPPTFGVSPEQVQGVIAGGDAALRRSIEFAEDDPAEAAKNLTTRGFTSGDVLVGISASGRTPYVLGALQHANTLGALTIGISCTPGSAVAQNSSIAITPAVGPEILTGSTRMKAGTATKLVLNSLSTAVMVRSGRVYGNLMVDVQPTNEKLLDRAGRIIAAITGVGEREARRLLKEGGSVKTAIVMQKLGLGREEAEQRILAARGRLHEALGE